MRDNQKWLAQIAPWYCIGYFLEVDTDKYDFLKVAKDAVAVRSFRSKKMARIKLSVHTLNSCLLTRTEGTHVAHAIPWESIARGTPFGLVAL